jgi:hypothetical protein
MRLSAVTRALSRRRLPALVIVLVAVLTGLAGATLLGDRGSSALAPTDEPTPSATQSVEPTEAAISEQPERTMAQPSAAPSPELTPSADQPERATLLPNAIPPTAVVPSGEPTGCGWGPASPTPGPDVVVVAFTCADAFDPMQPSNGSAGRRVEADAGLAERMAGALQGLLAGPTGIEREAGLTSVFSEATAGMLLSVTIVAGVADIDFADFSAAIPDASTGVEPLRLLSELNTTLFQFSQVDGFLYRFNGDCDAFWSRLQVPPEYRELPVRPDGCRVQTRG